MTIRELIEALTRIADKHGNLPVYGEDSDFGEDVDPGITIRVREPEFSTDRPLRVVIF